MMTVVLIVIAVIVALAGLFAIGARVQPKRFPPYPASGGAVETVPLPAGLPQPVDRYYRRLYGDRIPVSR